MPPRARKTTTTDTEPKLIDVGGVEVTIEQVQLALAVLRSAAGIMVAQPLRTVQHPLAACDYHSVAREQRELAGEPKAQTKPMFLAALERLAAGD